MTTTAQVTANRRNAAKSTGPKTEPGKKIAAQNALRHGLTARDIVSFDEKDGDFAGFHEGLRAGYQPTDPVEEQLVERVAICAWRLRRAARMEKEILAAYRDQNAEGPDPKWSQWVDSAPGRLANLSRYEVALDRAWQRAHLMLERRQAQRQGEAVPAPVAIMVEGVEAIEHAAAAGAKTENYETKPISTSGDQIDRRVSISRGSPPMLPSPEAPPSPISCEGRSDGGQVFGDIVNGFG